MVHLPDFEIFLILRFLLFKTLSHSSKLLYAFFHDFARQPHKTHCKKKKKLLKIILEIREYL